MKLFLLVLVFITSSKAFSATHCACEIGQSKSQKGIFRLDCKVWLSRKKSCTTKKIIDRPAGTKLLQYLPNLNKGDKLELGYVGNWSDASETIQYVEDQLLPVLQKKAQNIFYENMASYSMDDPDGVQEALVTMAIPPQSQITVKGTQGVAVGTLESLLWDYTRMYALASTDWLVTRFIDCENIEGKNCSSVTQGSDKGRCNDTKINRRIWLYCKQPKVGFGENQWQRD